MAARNRFGSPGCMIMVLIRGVLIITSPFDGLYISVHKESDETIFLLGLIIISSIDFGALCLV
jgi:hypothetical protein